MNTYINSIKLTRALLIILFVSLVFATVNTGRISAQITEGNDCPNNGVLTGNGCVSGEEAFPSEPVPIDADCDSEGTLTKENCGIILYLVNGIKFLTAVAFMAIIASVMFGGYQYMSARDNAGTVEAARKRITWAFVALGLLIFTNVFLQWVVPGGVF